MVELPKQLKDQAEEIERFYKQPTADAEGGAADPSAQADAELGDAGTSDSGYQAAEQATGGAEHSATTQSAPDDGWEQRYRSLQGMFNSETQRANQRVAHLEQLLASMAQPAVQAAQAAAKPKTEEPSPFVTDKDREEYGDSIDMVRRVSKEELRPITGQISELKATLDRLMASLNTSILPQVSNVVQQQAQTNEQRFWEVLAARVPDWQQVNDSAQFQQWLLATDPLTGTNRQVYLEQAQRSFDVGRVVNFFEVYKSLNGQSSSARAQPGRTTASELERQLAPGRSRNTGNPSTPTGRTYSPVEITKFFDDVRNGKYSGRQDERNRIERDIFAAQREGRIVANA